jgi:excisionase family DNA binding protein
MNEQILERLNRIEELITQQDTVMSFNEACKYTGLSPSQLYKLTSKAEIPHSKPNGKKIYFSKRELDSWLMRKRVKTSEEIEQEAVNHVGRKKAR